MNISAQTGPKGSYRMEHVLSFQENDYKCLMMDAYSAHMDDQVLNLCWERGYILLFHYGCTTGIAQINDTDLHQEFESTYIDQETQSFIEKQAIDPGDISRSHQEVIPPLRVVLSCVGNSRAVFS